MRAGLRTPRVAKRRPGAFPHLWACLSVTITVKLHYEAMHDELEALYLALQARYVSYGEGFRDAWKKGRRDALETRGWTEAEFYAELDRRRR